MLKGMGRRSSLMKRQVEEGEEAGGEGVKEVVACGVLVEVPESADRRDFFLASLGDGLTNPSKTSVSISLKRAVGDEPSEDPAMPHRQWQDNVNRQAGYLSGWWVVMMRQKPKRCTEFHGGNLGRVKSRERGSEVSITQSLASNSEKYSIFSNKVARPIDAEKLIFISSTVLAYYQK